MKTMPFLRLAERSAAGFFLVDELGRLFIGEQLQSLADLELAGLLLPGADLAEQALELLAHLSIAGLAQG